MNRFALTVAMTLLVSALHGGVAELRALGPDEAGDVRQVELSAVVTGVYPGTTGRCFVIADDARPGSPGIYATAGDGCSPFPAKPLEPGDKVELAGRIERGEFAPVVSVTRLSVHGHVPLPEAPLVTLADLAHGRLDSLRVRIDAVVMRVVERTYGVDLECATPDGVFRVIAPSGSGLRPEALVDAELSVTGVVGTDFNARAEWRGATVVTSSAGDVKIIVPPQDSASMALTPIDSLATFWDARNCHRKKVAGTVTLARSGRFFLQDKQNGAISVETADGDLPPVDSRVEVVGFVSRERAFAGLVRARWRVLDKQESAELPKPVKLDCTPPYRPDRSESAVATLDGSLVTFDARLSHVDKLADGTLIVFLSFDGRIVEAELPPGCDAEKLADLPSGTAVTATGIYCITERISAVDWEKWDSPVAFRLLLRGVDDVALRRDERFMSPLAVRTCRRLAVATLVLLVLAFGAGLAMHRRTLLAQARRFRESEIAFDAVLEERSRLAADLHDSLQQNLTAAALQIEALAAREGKDENPKRREALLKAGAILSEARSDVHDIVWNLRHRKGRDLAAELEREFALMPKGDFTVRLVAADVPQLGETVAATAHRVLKEAVTNALRHSGAKTVQVTLGGDGGDFVFAVTDDGRGFDPANVPGPSRGHFGLSGMAERVRRLGGLFRIDSAPGRGTRLEARIPVTASGNGGGGEC